MDLAIASPLISISVLNLFRLIQSVKYRCTAIRFGLDNLSVGRLMEFLTALRQDVEISVRPIRIEHGVLSVVSA